MSFWGTEIKPGKPFTHSLDRGRGRLHISQATLGIGSSTTKSLVQCNVGNKSPVFLCALLPDKTESCHLDVEFEEDYDVIFSVIGPRSVHLTGYYLGNGRHSNQNDDTESYGEDIGNSEADASAHSSDEGNYEDSFIDDGDPDVYPSSPLSNDKVVDEDMLDIKMPKEIHKRLKKKYQSIESDDHCSPRKNIISCFSGLESEDDEDHFPISSLYKSRTGKDDGPHARREDDGTLTINQENQADAVVDGEKECSVKDNLLRAEHDTRRIKQDLLVTNKQDEKPVTDKGLDLPNHSLLHSNEERNSKKKRKQRTKEGKTFEFGRLKDCITVQDKAEDQKPATDKGSCGLLPCSEAGSENGPKPKKRRKECAAEEIFVEGGANYNNVLKEDTTKQTEDKSVDVHPISEQDLKFSVLKSDEFDSNAATDGYQPGDNKSKKKKKKSKHSENRGTIDIEPLLPFEEKNRSSNGLEDKKVEVKPSQARILSNGLIIEELERGKPDGKIAAPGKKIKVHYVGKLKENGHVFDSNIGSTPFKFRLGAEDVIEGWNIGLDGSRVGDKRRLIIPPSMGYGNQGAGENIPPNSWLVYDVELIGIR